MLNALRSIARGLSDYIEMVKLFRGTASAQEAQVYAWHGMLRPMVPLLSVPVSYLVDYKLAIAIVDTGFVLLGTFAFFLMGERMFGPREGLACGIVFATALPVLVYGAAVLTDGAGYGALAVLTYVCLFMLPNHQSYRAAVIAGVLVGIGVLVKETNLLILVLVWIGFLINRSGHKFVLPLIVTVIALTISLGWSFAIGQSYIGYYGQGLTYHNATGYSGPLVNPHQFLVSVDYAFGIFLPFAIIGFFYVDDLAFKTLLELFVATGVVVLLWPTPPEDRLTFVLFPAVLLSASYGITQTSSILSKRPLLKCLSEEAWFTVIMVMILVVNNLYALRFLRLP